MLYFSTFLMGCTFLLFVRDFSTLSMVDLSFCMLKGLFPTGHLSFHSHSECFFCTEVFYFFIVSLTYFLFLSFGERHSLSLYCLLNLPIFSSVNFYGFFFKVNINNTKSTVYDIFPQMVTYWTTFIL